MPSLVRRALGNLTLCLCCGQWLPCPVSALHWQQLHLCQLLTYTNNMMERSQHLPSDNWVICKGFFLGPLILPQLEQGSQSNLPMWGFYSYLSPFQPSCLSSKVTYKRGLPSPLEVSVLFYHSDLSPHHIFYDCSNKPYFFTYKHIYCLFPYWIYAPWRPGPYLSCLSVSSVLSKAWNIQ